MEVPIEEFDEFYDLFASLGLSDVDLLVTNKVSSDFPMSFPTSALLELHAMVTHDTFTSGLPDTII